MTTKLTKSEIENELGKREAARREIGAFSHYVMPNYREAAFMKVMDKYLMEVVRYIETGEGISRLIIEAPPRHFKSWKVGRILPAFFLGRNPDKNVIVTSYSDTLAVSHSKIVREWIQMPQFQNLYGEKSIQTLDPDTMQPAIELDKTSKKMDLWQIQQYGGMMMGTSIGGAVTGWGSSCIIIDDPYRGRKEAESPTIRNTVLEYYDNTLYSRLEKGGAVIIIMQRWRKDDLVGTLKERSNPDSELYVHNADQWTVLTLPALSMGKGDALKRPEGEPLWAENFDVQELEKRRVNMGAYAFASQYQQNPTDPEGTIIKPQWIRKMHPPENIDYGIQVWDTAMKEGQENDFWVGGFFVPIPEGVLIRDLIREKMNSPEGKRKIIEFYNRWNGNQSKVTQIRIEDKVSGTPMIQTLQIDSRLPVVGYKPQGDKEYRLRTIAPYIESMRVFLPIGAPWIQEFIEELCQFPFGIHDDICLTSDTLILTKEGMKPIRSVRVGDLVWTGWAWRQVLVSKLTGKMADVIEVSMSNGLSITGTPNHPLSVTGKGFCAIDVLSEGDILVSWLRPKLSLWTGLLSGVTRKVATGIFDAISIHIQNGKKHLLLFIDTSGRRIMAKFQGAITCIIRTVTPSTTRLQILNYCQLLSTEEGILQHHRKGARTGSILNALDTRLQLGIVRNREENGTENRGNKIGREEKCQSRGANNVTSYSRHSSQKKQDAAPPSVQIGGEGNQESTMYSRSVSFVKRILSQINMTKRSFAPVSVTAIQDAGKADVYNLTIEGENQYFANGILVHNCDVVSEGIGYLAGGGAFTSRIEKREKTKREKLMEKPSKRVALRKQYD